MTSALSPNPTSTAFYAEAQHSPSCTPSCLSRGISQSRALNLVSIPSILFTFSTCYGGAPLRYTNLSYCARAGWLGVLASKKAGVATGCKADKLLKKFASALCRRTTCHIYLHLVKSTRRKMELYAQHCAVTTLESVGIAWSKGPLLLLQCTFVTHIFQRNASKKGLSQP